MTVFDITTDPGPYPQPWGLLDDDAQTIDDGDTTTQPQARITAFKMYELAGSAGGVTDDDAIHDNVAGEINAITEKVTPISADLVVIEDSAAGDAKKKVQIGNLPAATNIPTFTGTVTTTDATQTNIITHATTSDAAYHVRSLVVGRRTSDSAVVASFERIATYRNDGGTLTRVSTVTTPHTHKDDAGWGGSNLIATGTDILATVTGVAATNIDWLAYAEIIEV